MVGDHLEQRDLPMNPKIHVIKPGEVIDIEGDWYRITMNKGKIDPITRKPLPQLKRFEG